MQQKRKLPPIIDILILLVLMVYAFLGRDLVPFHGDESTLIGLSRDYFYLVEKKPLQTILYRDSGSGWMGDRQFNRIMTGAIDPLTIGLAADLSGFESGDINGLWVWYDESSGLALDFFWNYGWGNMPSDELLRAARTPSTIFLCLSIGLVYLITWEVSKNRLAGLAASLIYTLNPAVLVNGRRAMQEGAMLFFCALVIYLTLWVLNKQGDRSDLPAIPAGWYALLGLASGLAVASKHTAAVVVAVAFLCVLIAPLVYKKSGNPAATPFNWRHTLALIGAGFLALTVFFCFMPIWWDVSRLLLLVFLSTFLFSLSREEKGVSDWLFILASAAGLAAVTLIHPAVWRELADPPYLMLHWRGWLMDIQARQVSGFGGPGGRITYLLEQSFFAGTEYFEAWQWGEFPETITQIAAYESAWLNGHGGGFWIGIGMILLFLIGVFQLLSTQTRIHSIVIVLWLLLPALVLLISNALPWQRYYIILHQQIALLAGLGLSQIAGIFEAGANHG